MITGIIEHGKSLGRQLGFPTANIRPDGRGAEGIPADPNGVYAALIWIEGDPQPRAAMINQGHHPTAPEGKPTIEAHLLDYEGDLYGRRVRVEYVRYLRPEQRFESLDVLKAQLMRDEAETRRVIGLI